MVQNSYWLSKSRKIKALPLLESLIALIVISGSLLLFSSHESAPHFRSSLPATKRAKGGSCLWTSWRQN